MLDEMLAFERIVDTVDSTLRESEDRLKLDKEGHKAFIEFLSIDLQSIRFESLQELDDLKAIWDTIRTSIHVSDAVIDATTAMVLTANLLQFDGLQRKLAYAIGSMSAVEGKSENIVMDASDHERFTTPTILRLAFESNPWFMTLFLMRKTAFVRDLMSQMASAAIGSSVPRNNRDDRGS